MFMIQDKYKFGFRDYLKGNQIFERALAVNRLEELLEKRDQFDWADVPELKWYRSTLIVISIIISFS